MKEAEIKNLTCPILLIAWAIKSREVDACCMGSECPMWRTMPDFSGWPSPVEIIGYCGLAGRPK